MTDLAKMTDGRSDFDFEFGSWDVAHRVLLNRGTPDAQWVEFPGTSVARPVLGGLGNVEDNVLHHPGGSHRGVALRKFDPAIRTWSIWWMNDITLGLQDPVKGRFESGVGFFYADARVDGRARRTRYEWSEITPISARWEEAFSWDGGETWEPVWTMRFTRRSN
jgi:hypothetical protein